MTTLNPDPQKSWIRIPESGSWKVLNTDPDPEKSWIRIRILKSPEKSWKRIRILKGPEYGSNFDPDPQHGCIESRAMSSIAATQLLVFRLPAPSWRRESGPIPIRTGRPVNPSAWMRPRGSALPQHGTSSSIIWSIRGNSPSTWASRRHWNEPTMT